MGQSRSFIGSSPVLSRELSELQAEFRRQHGDLAVEAIDGQEISLAQLISDVGSVPFLSPTKLIVINRLSENGEARDRLEDILAAIAEGVNVVFVEPQPTKTAKFYKSLVKLTQATEASKQTPQDLLAFIKRRSKEASISVSDQQARLILELVGEDTLLIDQELSKILAYDDITDDLIKSVVIANPQAKVFDLLDVATSGNLSKSMLIYDDIRLQGEDPFKVFGLIVWQLNVLVAAKLVPSADAAQCKELGVSAYALGKARGVVSRITRQQLDGLIKDAVQTSLWMRRDFVDGDDCLRLYIARVSALFGR